MPADDVPLGEVAQSYLHPLRFPPQQHKLAPGIAVDPVTQRGYRDPAHRRRRRARVAQARQGLARTSRCRRALIPPKPIPQTAQQAALRALAEQATGTIERAERGVRAAAADAARGCAATRSASASRSLGGSALFIQGPPGSGKTYTGARLICELLAAGRRVGVAATSHKAIANLLDEVERAAAEAGVDFRGLKKSGGGNPESRYESAHVDSSADAARVPARATT